MNLFKKTAAAAMATMLLLTGCAGGNTTWAYKSGDAQMPTGLYIICEVNSISEAGTIVMDENKDNAEFKTPKPTELLKMTVEGQPATDWVNEKTQMQVREYFAVLKKFNELGLQLSDSELQAVDSGVSSVKSQAGDFYEKNGVSDASIKEYYIGQARKNALFMTLYGAGGEFEIPEDELKAYFAQNYVMVDAMPLYKSMYSNDETKTAEQRTAEVEADAKKYLEEMKQGKAIEDIAYEWQLKNTAEEGKAAVVKPVREDLRMVVTDSDRESFGNDFIDAVMGSSVGVPEMIEDPVFFAIFNRVDIMSDSSVFADYKTICMQRMKYDEYSEKLLEFETLLSLEANAATVKRYSPSKLKLEDATAAQ